MPISSKITWRPNKVLLIMEALLFLVSVPIFFISVTWSLGVSLVAMVLTSRRYQMEATAYRTELENRLAAHVEHALLKGNETLMWDPAKK